METWFWVFSWFLCILTMTRNGFVIFLVCNKRQLRTKSNTFIVSLVVADFFYGMIAVPSEFLCDAMNESSSVKKIKFDYNIYMGFHTWRLWNKLDYFSIGTIYRRRETFEILNFYEAPPSQSNGSYILGNPFSFQSYSIVKKLNSVHRISGYLHLFFEVSLCVI